jgi:hypothetical protein
MDCKLREDFGFCFCQQVSSWDCPGSPILPIALTLFYYDQRIRHEGYDIERMMETAGMNGDAALTAEAESATEAGVGEGQA